MRTQNFPRIYCICCSAVLCGAAVVFASPLRMLSPQENIGAPAFRQAYSEFVLRSGVEVSPRLAGIISLLSSAEPQSQREGLRQLIDFPKKFFDKSIFTVGKIDTRQLGGIYGREELIAAVRGERLILLSDLGDDHGSVVLKGNIILRQLLESLGVIAAADSQNGAVLVLSPVRDISPYVHHGETLHNRSFYEDINPEALLTQGSLIWKGIGSAGGENNIGLPFNIDRRSRDNWIYGGATREEVDVTADSAQKLRQASARLRQKFPEIPDDLFFVPVVSIQPLYLPVKAMGDFDYLRGYVNNRGKEVQPGVFLLPIRQAFELIKKTRGMGAEKERALEAAADKIRFFGYRAALPWRIREMWRYVPLLQEKTGTSDERGVFLEFVRRYALMSAIIHGGLDSVSASSKVLSGSGLSSMLSVNNMGYNIFDYSLLKSKSEYAREYVRQKLEEARNSGDLSREWMNQEPVVSFLDSKTVTLDWEAFRGRLLPVLRALALPRPELDAERARDLYVWARESLAEFSSVRSRELELLNGTVNELAGDIFINTGLAERNRLVIEGENELRRVYRKYSILFAELRSAEGDAAAADLFTGPVAPQSAGNRPSPGLILEQSI